MKADALIYCIDDSKDDLFLIEAFLKDKYHLKCFIDAKSALIELDNEEPDIILCDVMMPEIDGFEFAKNYRELYSYRDTAIVFLSSLDDPEKISQLLNDGAHDYLSKPISEKVLLAKIEKTLKFVQEKRNQKTIIDLVNADREKIIKLVSSEFYNTKITFIDKDIYESYEIIEGKMDEEIKKKISNYHGKVILSQTPIEKEKFYKKIVQPSIKGKGLISKISLKDKVITIQTEVANYPYLHIQSIADLGGKIIDKLTMKIEADIDETTISRNIQELHNSLENKIKEKISSKLSEPKKDVRDFNVLLEEGFELYRSGKLKEALDIWFEAKKIKPDDKILEVNIDILQKKILKMQNQI